MNSTEADPDIRVCQHGERHRASQVDTYPPKEVTLGSEDAMRVRRTLPNMSRSFVGAWCLIDHTGPRGARAWTCRPIHTLHCRP